MNHWPPRFSGLPSCSPIDMMGACARALDEDRLRSGLQYGQALQLTAARFLFEESLAPTGYISMAWSFCAMGSDRGQVLSEWQTTLEALDYPKLFSGTNGPVTILK